MPRVIAQKKKFAVGDITKARNRKYQRTNYELTQVATCDSK
jgi:hypothetical protein